MTMTLKDFLDVCGESAIELTIFDALEHDDVFEGFLFDLPAALRNSNATVTHWTPPGALFGGGKDDRAFNICIN